MTLFFKLFLIFSLNYICISRGLEIGLQEPKYSTCPINLTVSIDFSSAMQSHTNVKFLIDFILNNFTNTLPFNDPNFYISLLSYGTINGSQIFGPFRSYQKFYEVIYQQWNISQQYGLQKPDLNKTLWTYWDYITIGQNLDILRCAEDTSCINKLVLFTAIDDNATINVAINISDKINNYSFITAIGINMTHGIYLFDIGRRIYQVFFDDYNYYKEIPLVPYLQDILCKMNVPAPKQVPCGDGFCESILCGHLSNGYLRCQYLAGCILDQCYYWRHSSRKWSVGVTYCEIINSTMLMIYNETIQEEIYKIFGDFEYWTGLWSNLYVNPVWMWSGTNLTLIETNYTNWSDGQPDTDNGNNLCVSDTNSSELTQHWKVLPCTNAETQRFFMCTRAPSLPYDLKPKQHELSVLILVGAFLSALGLSIVLFLSWKIYKKFKNSRAPDRNRTTSSNTTHTVITTLSIPKLPAPDSVMFARIFGLMRNVNKLSFPNDNHIHEFEWRDLENLGLLAANTRHRIGKFRHIPSNTVFAAKFLTIPYDRFDNEDIRRHYKKMLNEVENFRKLWECENIVSFYGLCVYEGHVLLCMELMDLSLKQLYTLVHSTRKEKFSEETIGYIFVKIFDALLHCSSKKILHRDIKPDNILVNRSGEIKLCDFGESRFLNDSVASSDVGTISYCPPERFSENCFKYDSRSDVWSLGITIIEVILGQLPYILNKKYNERCVQYFIQHTNFCELIDQHIGRHYSEDLSNLLKICTDKLEYRPKLGNLKETRFYAMNKSISKDQIELFFHLL